MRSLAAAALILFSCTKPAPPSPVGERAAPATSLARRSGGGAGVQGLAWISEASGTPQVILEGTPLTGGPAAHYLGAAAPTHLYVTRSIDGTEQLLQLSFDGGVRPLNAPSLRARSVTTARGLALFESGEAGLSSIASVDGGPVITHEAGSFEPSLSPDGTWFAFVSSRDGDAEIYRANLDGGQLLRLTAFHLDDVSPRVSPDGAWIAFISNREGQDRVFLVRPDGRGQRRLHASAAQDGRWDAGDLEPAEADPAWAPDSRRVFFSARGPRGHWHLFSAELTSGALTQLSDGPWDDQLPAVSPDGARLAFVSSRDGNAELYVMTLDGGSPRRLTFDPAADWKPAWVPQP